MDKIRYIQGSLFPLYCLEMAVKFWGRGGCGGGGSRSIREWGIWRGCLHQLVLGHRSLCPQCFTCSCVWVHHGLWLLHAAPANSESSSQPLFVMSTTLSGTMKNLMGSCLDCRRFETVRSLLALTGQLPFLLWCSYVPKRFAAHSGFTQEARHRSALLLEPSKASWVVYHLHLGFGRCQPRRTLEPNSLCSNTGAATYYLCDFGPITCPSMLQVSHLQNGIS